MRKYLIAGVRLLAKALGISERAARRRAASMPGARKVGGQWQVPVDTETYARGAGVSRRTAQRRGVAAASPSDPEIQSRMPTSLPARGGMRHTRVDGKRMVNPRIWPYQYQGMAWVQFVASHNIIRVFSSTIVSKVRFTVKAFVKAVRDDIEQKFNSSPVKIISIDVVYAWEVA